MMVFRFIACIVVLELLYAAAAGQCTPIAMTNSTFEPAPEDLSCIINGTPYNEVLYFDLGDVQILTGPDSISIDSVLGLPSGIGWSGNFVFEDSSSGHDIGCIVFSGITTDSSDNYPIEIWVTLWFRFTPGLGPSPLDIAAIDSSRYYLKVRNTGTFCGDFKITGFTYFDENSNGTYDGQDAPLNNQEVKIMPGYISVFTDPNGYYSGTVFDTTAYNVTAIPSPNYAISSIPPSYLVTTNLGTVTYPGNDFGLSPTSLIDDVTISISASRARPGFETTHWITYENTGTTLLSGTITYTFDPDLTFKSFEPSSISFTHQANQINWSYQNLYPNEHRRVTVDFEVPRNSLGDTLYSTVQIEPIQDATNDNRDSVIQVIVGSFDPNDKSVSHNEASPNKLLEYLIRFQNTGTDTAFTVAIRDTLDENLDLSKFRVTGSSHAYKQEIIEDRYVKWTFENIFLPDSNINEPASHGFISYLANVGNTLTDGVEINNRAAIYFDFNSPIITNTAATIVKIPTSIQKMTGLKSSVRPNPFNNATTVQFSRYLENVDFKMFDITGKIIRSQFSFSGKEVIISGKGLPDGFYHYFLLSKNQIIDKGKLLLIK